MSETETDADLGQLIELPRCSISGCETVATRRVWSLVIDSEEMGELRLCYECENAAKDAGEITGEMVQEVQDK